MASVEIFAPGTVLSMEGQAVTLTAEDLQGIADRYDPALHEAPFVVGHPTHDAPAYGWTKTLSFADGRLVAEGHQIDDGFAELHRKGRLKKVSSRFYTPTSPNNPTPGQWYLMDVGFLGAMPPAVKGLRTASFSEAAQGAVAVASFGELPGWTGNSIAGLFRRLREQFIAIWGQDVADRVLPDYEIEGLRAAAQSAAMEDMPRGLSFTDPGRQAALDAATRSNPSSTKDPMTQQTEEQLRQQLGERDAEIRRLQAAEASRQAAQRHADHVSFTDGLVSGGRWPAGMKDVLVATLDALATPAAADKGVVSFGDGDAAKPLHVVLQEQLKALPERVSFGEIATKGTATAGQMTDRQKADRAAAYRADMARKGTQISIGQAIDAVEAGLDKP